MTERLWGIVLFLPVPLVLFLFTRAPLGIGVSLLLGVAIMATHRLYARPFALARAERRCLWCGRTLPPADPAAAAPAPGPGLLTVEEPLGTTRWRACAGPHEENARRFLGYAHDHAVGLKLGILLPLVVFLATAGLVAIRYPWPVTYADAVNAFRLAIAGTVLPLSMAFAVRKVGRPLPADPLPVPFPLHIQALVGTSVVVWAFRLVGLAWMALGLAYWAGRLGRLA